MTRPGYAWMDAAVPATSDEAQVLGEEGFRLFYDRTARPLWAYLYRATRDAALADDLLQESYYRLLRARSQFDGDSHRAHYLFRIAANLVTDARRRAPAHLPLDEHERHLADAKDGARAVDEHRDLERALETLSPRDRDMLWLAYADGASHAEIAEHLGVGRPSIKAMLWRARQRLAARLRRVGGMIDGRRRA